MKTIIRKQEVDQYSIEEQLNFYRSDFHTQHCQADWCGREVGHHWVIYDCTLYCENCFDHIKEQEEKERAEEIERLRARLNELESQ